MTSSETPSAVDGTQTAGEKGSRHRVRPARPTAQLRSQGRRFGTVKFEARIRELVEGNFDLSEIVEPLLDARRKLQENFATLHRKLLTIVRNDEVCRRLMTIPAVGPVVALADTATIDIPLRFRNSKAVGPILRLAPVQPIGREPPHRLHLAVWRRHDTDFALRSRASPAGQREKYALAESLGNERGQAAWGGKKPLSRLHVGWS